MTMRRGETKAHLSYNNERGLFFLICGEATLAHAKQHAHTSTQNTYSTGETNESSTAPQSEGYTKRV